MGRLIRSRSKTVAALVALPDAFSLQAASLGLATNPFSAMSAGVHQAGASAKGWMGDPGYGVNRWAGRLPRDQPYQHFGGATAPVTQPSAARLGIGAMVSGQPGLPSTGDTTGATAALGWVSLASMNPGMVG
jgi:hypothetical protein